MVYYVGSHLKYMSADKNATAAAALIQHVTSIPDLDPADRSAVNAAIFCWAWEQVQLHVRCKALLAEDKGGDAAQLRADNGSFIKAPQHSSPSPPRSAACCPRAAHG